MRVQCNSLNRLEMFPHPPLLCEGRGDPDGPTDNQAGLRHAWLEVKHLERRRVWSEMKEGI